MSIDLSNVLSCQAELQRCSNGLAYLDHWWCAVLDEVDEAEQAWDTVEAKAAAEARNGDKALTAVEVKGRITAAIDADEDASAARERLRNARSIKAKVERYFRSLEKRIGAAQSAQNGHGQLARGGGV